MFHDPSATPQPPAQNLGNRNPQAPRIDAPDECNYNTSYTPQECQYPNCYRDLISKQRLRTQDVENE